MDSTSSPDQGRQSRGLARFWPVHGTPAPEQRQSDDAAPEPDAGSPQAESAEPRSAEARSGEPRSPETGSLETGSLEPRSPESGPSVTGLSAPDPSAPGLSVPGLSVPGLSEGRSLGAAHAGPVAGSGPTSEQPQVDAVRRTGETHIVALGSRRPPEIVTGGRPSGPGGFPPPQTEHDVRAAEPGPRHGGPPIPTALPVPPSRSRFGGPGPEADAGSGPFRPAASPFGPGPPFASASPFEPRAGRGSSDQGSRGAGWAAGSERPGAGGRFRSGGTAGRFGPEERGGTVPLGAEERGGTVPLGAEERGGTVPLGAEETRPDKPDRIRADAERAGPARGAGWASLPTSGIPTLASGPMTETGAGRRLEDNGGRRSRADEPQIAAPKRSTTLGDAEEPRPRAGRRAAREATDEVDGGGGAEGDGPDAAITKTAADEKDETSATAESADTAPAADRHRDDSVDVDAGRNRTDAELNDRPDGVAPAADAKEDDRGDASATDSEVTGRPDDTASATDAEANRRRGDTASATDAEANVDARSATGAQGNGRREDTSEAKPDAPMRPGDVDETLIAFWDDKAIDRFRAEWHEVKADFVDDPVAALTRAHDLITEAVDDLTEALLAERDQLDPLRVTSTPDTESMRMAMRGYREFLDRILAL